MKKSEYVTKISTDLKMTKTDVEKVTNAFIKELINSLAKKDTVSITNLGTFTKITTKAFTYFSPVDGKKITTDGITKISFSSSKNLLKKLSGDSKNGNK